MNIITIFTNVKNELMLTEQTAVVFSNKNDCENHRYHKASTKKAAHYRRLNSSNLIDLARSTSPYHSLLTNALPREARIVQLREIATVQQQNL